MRPSVREVVAVYTIDEGSMELVVQLPINFPLGPVNVDSGKKVGVTAAQWRTWMLQLTTFLQVDITIINQLHNVRNLHFLSKNSTLISRENCRILGVKTRENVVVLDFLAVDNFDFTRKIVKKNLGENS